MQSLVLLGAAVVLVVTVAIGVVVHELSHAAVLHLLGIPYEIRWFPKRNDVGRLNTGLFRTWAAVTPRRIPPGSPTWGLRLSALAPLTLTLPFVFVPLGIVPDPLNSSNAFILATTVAWFACALPSPQDFSVFWYADRAIADLAEPSLGN